MYNGFTYGIRLVDLIDINRDSIDVLYREVGSQLITLFDRKIYPVDDIDFFNDFIERMCDKYYSRTLAFDTYNEFFIKLKFVLENNKLKYQQMFKAAAIEINPLYTYFDYEKAEDNLTLGTSVNTTIEDNRRVENRNENTGTDTSTTEYKSESSVTNTTLNNKSITGMSSNPKSNTGLSTDISNLDYIDNESININVNDYKTVTKPTGSDVNRLERGTATEGFSQNSGEMTNNVVNSGTNTSILERIKHGYNGSPVELMQKYSKMIFDVNKEILNDIDDANLFMSVFF